MPPSTAVSFARRYRRQTGNHVVSISGASPTTTSIVTTTRVQLPFSVLLRFLFCSAVIRTHTSCEEVVRVTTPALFSMLASYNFEGDALGQRGGWWFCMRTLIEEAKESLWIVRRLVHTAKSVFMRVDRLPCPGSARAGGRAVAPAQWLIEEEKTEAKQARDSTPSQRVHFLTTAAI